jgi:hypothetical protein
MLKLINTQNLLNLADFTLSVFYGRKLIPTTYSCSLSCRASAYTEFFNFHWSSIDFFRTLQVTHAKNSVSKYILKLSLKVTPKTSTLSFRSCFTKLHQKIERRDLLIKSSSLAILNHCFVYAYKLGGSSQNRIQQAEISDY